MANKAWMGILLCKNWDLCVQVSKHPYVCDNKRMVDMVLASSSYPLLCCPGLQFIASVSACIFENMLWVVHVPGIICLYVVCFSLVMLFLSLYYHHNLPTISVVFLLFFRIVYHKNVKCKLFKQWERKSYLLLLWIQFKGIYEGVRTLYEPKRREKKRLPQPCHIIASHQNCPYFGSNNKIFSNFFFFFWFELLLIGVDWKHMECIPLVSTQMMADDDATERNAKQKKSGNKFGRPVVCICRMLFTLDLSLTKRFFFCRNKTDLNTKWEYDSTTMNKRNANRRSEYKEKKGYYQDIQTIQFPIWP